MPGIIEPQGAPEPGAPRRPLGSRLIWFFGLALGGMAVTAAAAYGLRAVLFLR